MYPRNYLLALWLAVSAPAVAQTPPEIIWQKCFGGTLDDTGYGITATNDGGFLFAGCAGSSNGDILLGPLEEQHGGTCDFWAAKIDAGGNIQFKVHLGGTGTDVARTPLQTKDGNYLLGGSTGSADVDVTDNHGDLDFWLTKVNGSGGVIWKKCFGGTGYDDFGAVVNSDGSNMAFCGGTLSNNGDVSGSHGSSDFWLVKTDADGNILWQKCYGGSGYEKAFDLKATSDGGYILAGFTESNDGDVSGNHSADYDGWVVKTDASGNLQWQKCLGGSSQDGFFSVAQMSNQNFVVAGYAFSSNGDINGNKGKDDAWIASLDMDGNLLWSRTYGGDSSDEFYSISEDMLGKIIAGGFSRSFDGDLSSNYGDKDYWLLRLETNGDILWSASYGGTYADVCYDVALANDGTAVVTGYTTSNDEDVSGNHGAIDPYEAKKDYWLVKLESVVGIGGPEQNVFSIWPTLAHDRVLISFAQPSAHAADILLRDITGSLLFTTSVTQSSQTTLDVSGLLPGTYLIEVRGQSFQAVSPFMKQ